MIAMQYEVTLPADYDMSIVDERIDTRGGSLDRLPGLGLKAYAVRRREHGSQVNQYAPIYLWQEEQAMTRFLAGEGFRGLCESFGCPLVRYWVGVAYQRGVAYRRDPAAASRELIRLDSEGNLTAQLAEAQAAAHDKMEAPGLHSIALAIDPYSWQLARFILWHERVPDIGGIHYEIRHVSSPMIDQL